MKVQATVFLVCVLCVQDLGCLDSSKVTSMILQWCYPKINMMLLFFKNFLVGNIYQAGIENPGGVLTGVVDKQMKGKFSETKTL